MCQNTFDKTGRNVPMEDTALPGKYFDKPRRNIGENTFDKPGRNIGENTFDKPGINVLMKQTALPGE